MSYFYLCDLMRHHDWWLVVCVWGVCVRCVCVCVCVCGGGGGGGVLDSGCSRNYHDNNDDNGYTTDANVNSNTVICTSNAVVGHNKLKTNHLWCIIILGTSVQETRGPEKQKRFFRIIICSRYRAHIDFLFKTNCCMKVYYQSMA